MLGGDILIVIAEVAAAFAGFAGIVTIFRQRISSGSDTPDAFRFRFMVETSLLTVAFALLPFVFHHLGMPTETLWPACSAVLALVYIINIVRVPVRARRVRSAPGAKLSAWMWTLLVGGALVAFVMLTANVLRVGFDGEFGPYLFGLAWLLTISGVMFFRLLLVRTGGGGGDGT